MRTIQVNLPDPVVRQAQELALLENVPVEQLVSLAVTQAIGTWTAERSFAKDERNSNRRRFLEMLQEALDSEEKNLNPPPASQASSGV